MENEKTPTTSLVQALGRLFSLLRLDRKDISAIYVFAILSGFISLSLPLGIQTIVTFVQTNEISASVIVLIVIVVVAVFFGGLVQVRQRQVIERVEQKIFTRYSLEFASRLPKLDIEKLDKYYLPELVNRFFDTPALTKGIEKIMLDIPAAVIQVLFGLILLSFYHPVFIAFGALLIVIVLIIIRFTSPQGLATALKASDYKYGIAAWIEETARVIKSFKYSKGTSLHIQKTDELVTHYLESRTNHFKILLTQYWSFIVFKILITAAMLIMGSILLVNQQINVGQFVAADIVIIAIISSVEKLILSLDKVYDALTSIQKVSKVLDSEVETTGTAILAEPNNGVSISFNNVSFAYSDGNKVLNNITFNINPGQFVCIAGSSGSGKSSILRLLTGAFKKFDGVILVDSVPITNYNLKSLRSQTGILLSQQDIFHGSLLENITLGNPNILLSEVTQLADEIGLSDYVNNNKEGYDTILDPLGKKLSRKVRQDILLLRALIGKHRLLLLEEPFDHLDDKQRNGVMNFLRKNKSSTIIITSEKEEMIFECDQVIRLEEGIIL
ncbi:MAG: ABC transporter ATP-binding protein/permease [Chitinophagaceae bacterium]|jgi:ABC-type bacteriocin/lantibiotic exporter with double-glycine peptidase domain|nr:ABC transporter ATP-binding protein/permease [Chitinophagaceae bacterium]